MNSMEGLYNFNAEKLEGKQDIVISRRSNRIYSLRSTVYFPMVEVVFKNKPGAS